MVLKSILLNVNFSSFALNLGSVFKPLSFRSVTKGVKEVDKSNLTLLGALIFPEAIGTVLESKLENLQIMASQFKKIDSHAALFLLKNCFTMHKLIYFLRSSPCFMRNDILQQYDSIIKQSLINILNIKLPEHAWNQAMLPALWVDWAYVLQKKYT